MAAPKVTQALIYAEIVHIREQIEEHTKQDNQNFQELRRHFEGTDTAPGIKIRVDRIEQAAQMKTRHFAYLWSFLLVVAGAVVKLLIG
jgi:hypothetical protein